MDRDSMRLMRLLGDNECEFVGGAGAGSIPHPQGPAPTDAQILSDLHRIKVAIVAVWNYLVDLQAAYNNFGLPK